MAWEMRRQLGYLLNGQQGTKLLRNRRRFKLES